MAHARSDTKESLRATLRDLVALHGVSGFEQPLVAYFTERVGSLADQVDVDRYGNVTAISMRTARMRRGTSSTGAGSRACSTGARLMARAKGNLVPDAYLAALAIESGSEWTSDRDYARFRGLRRRDPGA